MTILSFILLVALFGCYIALAVVAVETPETLGSLWTGEPPHKRTPRPPIG